MLNQSIIDISITVILLQITVIPLIITLLGRKLTEEIHKNLKDFFMKQKKISITFGVIIILVSIGMRLFTVTEIFYDLMLLLSYSICLLQLYLLGRKWEGTEVDTGKRRASLVKLGPKENLKKIDWMILGGSLIVCIISLAIYYHYSISLALVPFHVKEFFRPIVIVGIVLLFFFKGDTHDKSMCKVVIYSMSFLLIMLSYGNIKMSLVSSSSQLSTALSPLPLILVACFSIFTFLKFRKV